ncbi:Outer membrane receptor proteins, mostly Fe transport [Flexibacter flexilis DSM 6793]|uniref:Outer membrane receptor proteins, mostly Fe transport n=1 Tax=Flexibacter flexilis DSM 6793 TaxID=927664 RepID=A0A1I1JHI2_9BACT|nr:TonB-dependent receptor plug domain-containing protein [Flexibacter flexilis]SFC48079.1 Outer membrane receptor proteins, mostly Fe transport [Flexibacter flexilis DSM 6793]
MKKILLFVFISMMSVSALAQIVPTAEDTMRYENLLMLSLEELMNIEVSTASKNNEKLGDAPAIFSIITQNDIQSYGANNILDLLDRVTSVYSMGSALLPDNVVSIRGDATTHYNNHVLVLINGRPFRDNIGGGIRMALYLMYPLARITRIEIIRGPGSVLYGTGAYTGVINIITKEADKQNSTVSASVGGFGRSQISAVTGKKFGHFAISGGVNALQEKGWDFTASDNGYFGSSPRVTRTIKMLQEGIGADLNMKYKDLTASAYYGNSKQRAMYFPQSWSSYTSITKNGDTSQVYKDYNAINEVFFGDLGYRKDITKNWNLAVNGTFNRTKLTEASEDANDDIAVSTSTDWIGEFTNTFKLGTKGNLLVGGLANGISGEQTFPISLKKDKTTAAPYQAVGFGSFNIYNDHLGKNPDAPYIIEPYEEVWYSGYVQADYKVLPELKLVAGGQVNKVPKIKADFVPRLGAIYNFSDEIGTKILYGEAFRVGSSSERFIKVDFVFGDKNLKPEKIRTTEIMLFFKDKNNKFNSSLTYFHSDQNNLINRSAQAAIDAHLPTSELIINTGKRISQGLEFDFVYNLNRYFNMQGSFTAMSSLDKVNAKTAAHTDTIYEVSDYQATPQSMAKAGITYNGNGIMVGIFDSFFQGTLRTNQYGTALMPRLNPAIQSFHWLSAQVQLDLYRILNGKALEGLQLGVYGKNLLNEKVMMADPQFGINSMPARGGRQIMFSISYTFDRMGQ